MAYKKRLSISFSANLLIFGMSLFVIAIELIKNQYDIAQSIAIIIKDNNQTSSTVYSFLILFFFFPILLYFIKLNFSLASIEHNQQSYNTYLKKLKLPYFLIENIFRLLIYTSLLMLLANLSGWIPTFFNKLSSHQIVGYGVAYDISNNYTIPVKGFPSLINIICFNVFFFIILLIWDAIVYFGNWASNNKLNFKQFFLRFIFHHILGLIIWFFFLFILLTSNGYLILHKWYLAIGIGLGIVLSFYLYSLLHSMWDLKTDFKLALIDNIIDNA